MLSSGVTAVKQSPSWTALFLVADGVLKVVAGPLHGQVEVSPMFGMGAAIACSLICRPVSLPSARASTGDSSSSTRCAYVRRGRRVAVQVLSDPALVASEIGLQLA